MRKKYRIHLLISSLVILLPMIVGGVLWLYFPDKMIVHWNFQGQPDGVANKGFVIFGLPLFLLFLHWIGIFFTIKDRKNENQSKKVFLMIFWILPVLSLAIWVGIYSTALGISMDISKITLMIIPFMFIIMGNYMPKCKQNYTIGIKVVWTLRSEENWNKTHRFAGKLWVYGGILIVISLLCVPVDKFIAVVAFIPITMALLPVLYSYMYYKKQLQEGSVTKEEMKVSSRSIVIMIFVIVILLLLLFRGKYEVQFQEDFFTVQADLWTDITVSYDEIKNIEYFDRKKSGRRTFGYGSINIVMGECENSTWGNYTAYLFMKTEPCILLTIDDKILVINERDEEKTQQLYEDLISHWKTE